MSISRPVAILVFLVSLVVLPLLSLTWFFVPSPDTFHAVLKTLLVGTFLWLMYIIGYWGFLIYRLRIVFLIAFLVWVPLSFIINPVSWSLPHEYMKIVSMSVIELILIFLLIEAINARKYKSNPIKLSFPLKGGTYYVLEGGDSKGSRFVNYHFQGSSHQKSSVNKSMRYAVDIVQLNNCGCFANGFIPTEVNKYIIFNQTIYSPCSGKVVDVVDTMVNEVPFSGRHPYNVGNRIIIEKEDVFIILGHIQMGSILVKIGDKVDEGQPIASIGNSGFAEFLHLHIQVTKVQDDTFWSGEGVPILFNGKFLVKNNIVR